MEIYVLGETGKPQRRLPPELTQGVIAAYGSRPLFVHERCGRPCPKCMRFESFGNDGVIQQLVSLLLRRGRIVAGCEGSYLFTVVQI